MMVRFAGIHPSNSYMLQTVPLTNPVVPSFSKNQHASGLVIGQHVITLVVSTSRRPHSARGCSDSRRLFQRPVPLSLMIRKPTAHTCRVISFLVGYEVQNSGRFALHLTLLIFAHPCRTVCCFENLAPCASLILLPFRRREQCPRLADESPCSSSVCQFPISCMMIPT